MAMMAVVVTRRSIGDGRRRRCHHRCVSLAPLRAVHFVDEMVGWDGGYRLRNFSRLSSASPKILLTQPRKQKTRTLIVLMPTRRKAYGV